MEFLAVSGFGNNRGEAEGNRYRESNGKQRGPHGVASSLAPGRGGVWRMQRAALILVPRFPQTIISTPYPIDVLKP